MATVLVGAFAQNPATTWPNLYSSCVWNFVTGWTCQTVDAPPPPAPPSPGLPPVPPPAPLGGGLPIMGAPASSQASGGGNGCCGCTGGGAMPGAGVQTPAMSLATIAGPTVKPCCGKCAPKGRGLILVAALVALVLVLRARLNA